MKAIPPRSFRLLPVFLVVACSTSNQVADFARNDVLYADVPFRTKLPGDRAAFVAPVVDTRPTAPPPTNERGFPIAYANDDFYERPVAEMVGEVLVRQLADSELFPAIHEQANAEELWIQPSLVSFLGGTTAGMSGARSFAEVGLRLQVFGPIGVDGKRPLVHDQVYGNRQATELELNPVSPYRLYGRALQLTMHKALSGLDSSNCSRRDAPTGASLPVEASTPAH